MTEKSIPYRVGYKLTVWAYAVEKIWIQFWEGVEARETKTEPKVSPQHTYCPHCPPGPPVAREYRVQDGKCIQCGAAR